MDRVDQSIFRYCCEECQGENIKLKGGWEKWDVETQEWEVCDSPDDYYEQYPDDDDGEWEGYYCEDCKKRVEVDEVEEGVTLDEIMDNIERVLR